MKKSGRLNIALSLGVGSMLCLLPVQTAVAGSSGVVTAATVTPQTVSEGKSIKKSKSSADEQVDPQLAKSARSAVIMDFATGKVLYDKEADEELPMASITKIMTMLLVMEALDDGKIKLTDKVKASEHAASMGGSQIFLEPGETMTVNDLMKGIAMASANDACVALAEHLAGSEATFVKQMNQKAKLLGMEHTHFVNCNGLPADNHYSCAQDIAVMSRALLAHNRVTKWTSVYSDYLRENSSHPLWLVNTNKLVRFYDGMDGLKTGFTSEAKYCLSATAKRDGFRVIAVVMGEPRIKDRNREVSEMLNWTFAQYRSKVLYPAGHVLKQVRVPHGVPEMVTIKTGETVGIIHPKGEKWNYTTQIHLDKIHAPLHAGDKVGSLNVLKGQQIIASTPLVSNKDVRKANLLESIGQTARHIVTFGH